MAKKKKNSNYQTPKVIEQRKREEEALKRKELSMRIVKYVIIGVLIAALIAGVVAMGFGLGWWGGEEKVNDFTPTHHASIEVEGYGTIHLELYGEEAPITVENFVKLANGGYYNGSSFHRVIEGFMAQGGRGATEADEIVGEFDSNGIENPIKHVRGVISMARGNDPDSASSEFFIVHGEASHLDGAYAAFGAVIDGMEVIDAICEAADPNADNGMLEKADQAVIKSISIHEAH